MKKIVLAVLACSGIAGCGTVPVAGGEVGTQVTVPFDAAGLAWSKAPGNNSVSGDAVLRTRGGDVKTCAGLDVMLLPASPYSEAFVGHKFGSSSTGGYYSKPYLLAKEPQLDPAAAEYVRAKKCNAQGQFSFTGLPDGDYYVIATVEWEAPSQYGLNLQGGDLAKRVHLAGGQAESITITE